MASKGARVQREMLLPNEVLAYVKQHGIDEVTTAALNEVLRHRPADPIGHLAGSLACRSTAPPRFGAVRPDASTPRSELRFHVVVAARGVHARLHSFGLQGILLAKADAAVAGAEPVLDETARLVLQKQEEEALMAFLEGFFCKAFQDVPMSEFFTLHERCDGLAQAPTPAGYVVDVPRATAAITQELLVAAARSRCTTRMGFLQQMLAQEGGPDLTLASPPLRTLQDLAAWHDRWLRISMPIFHGGGPSPVKPAGLRVCMALSPLAVGKPDAASATPQPGWLPAIVKAMREASTNLSKDKANAAMVVNGVVHCPASLEKSLEMAQRAAEAAAGGRQAETSGVLLACAEEAWLEDEAVYEFEAGRKLALEQLVEFYDGLAKTGWLRMLVNPFRQADALAGCDLLHARRPELRLVMDYGGAEPLPVPRRAQFSCGLALEGSVPSWLQRYIQLATQWAEAGGCGRCLWLDSHAAAAMPAALEVAMACAEPEVLCLARDVTEADIMRLSTHVDDVLYAAMFPLDDCEPEN